MQYITIHCSATRPSMDIGAAEIRRWHADPKPHGNGWADIGYHEVIRRDGTCEHGRPAHVTGAHVGGHNTGNYGICLVGGVKESDGKTPENNFTPAQWNTLATRMREHHAKWPNALIMGHNGFPGHESRGCPCFDWRAWRDAFLKGLQEEPPQFPSHWYDEVDFNHRPSN